MVRLLRESKFHGVTIWSWDGIVGSLGASEVLGIAFIFGAASERTNHG